MHQHAPPRIISHILSPITPPSQYPLMFLYCFYCITWMTLLMPFNHMVLSQQTPRAGAETKSQDTILHTYTTDAPIQNLISLDRTNMKIVLSNTTGEAFLDPHWRMISFHEEGETTKGSGVALRDSLLWDLESREGFSNASVSPLHDISTSNNSSSNSGAVPIPVGMASILTNQQILIYQLNHTNSAISSPPLEFKLQCGTMYGSEGNNCNEALFRLAMDAAFDFASGQGIFVIDQDISLKRMRFINFTTGAVETVLSFDKDSEYGNMAGRGPTSVCTSSEEPHIIYLTSQFDVWRVNMSNVQHYSKIDPSRAERIAGYTGPGRNDAPTGTEARFTNAWKCLIWKRKLYVLDRDAHCIRAIDTDAPFSVSTYAGECGTERDSNEKENVRFRYPSDLMQFGNELLVLEQYSQKIHHLVDGDLWAGTPNFTCGDGNPVHWYEPNACSSHGICEPSSFSTSGGFCACENHYRGKSCEITSCDELSSVSESVCSGHGKCLSYNNCTCAEGWTSSDRKDYPSCDICELGFYRKVDECIPCNCNVYGSIDVSCNNNGTCSCKSGYRGEKCDTCAEAYYQPGPIERVICLPCNCSLSSAVYLQCNSLGFCKCKDKWYGSKCLYSEKKLTDMDIQDLEREMDTGVAQNVDNSSSIISYLGAMLQEVDSLEICTSATCLIHLRKLYLSALNVMKNVSIAAHKGNPGIVVRSIDVMDNIAKSRHAGDEVLLGLAESMNTVLCHAVDEGNYTISSPSEVSTILEALSMSDTNLEAESVRKYLNKHNDNTITCLLKAMATYGFRSNASPQIRATSTLYTAAMWPSHILESKPQLALNYGEEGRRKEEIQFSDGLGGWNGVFISSISPRTSDYDTSGASENEIPKGYNWLYRYRFYPENSGKKMPPKMDVTLNIIPSANKKPVCMIQREIQGENGTQTEWQQLEEEDSNYQSLEALLTCTIHVEGEYRKRSMRVLEWNRHSIITDPASRLPVKILSEESVGPVPEPFAIKLRVDAQEMGRTRPFTEMGPGRIVVLILAFAGAIIVFVIILAIILAICHCFSFLIVASLTYMFSKK